MINLHNDFGYISRDSNEFNITLIFPALDGSAEIDDLVDQQFVGISAQHGVIALQYAISDFYGAGDDWLVLEPAAHEAKAMCELATHKLNCEYGWENYSFARLIDDANYIPF